jgi:caffeoyl-CoA O-methyltransferase
MQEILNELKEYAVKNNIPIIDDLVKDLLIKTLKENDVSDVLEIGTAIGYSGIIILNEVKSLITIDINKERLDIASKAFKTANLNNYIILNEDALLTIKNLSIENKVFDFIFLDGPKGQYINYVPFLIKILKVNGILFADNVFLDKIGKRYKTIKKRLEMFLDYITNNEVLQTAIINVHDGVSISRKLK